MSIVEARATGTADPRNIGDEKHRPFSRSLSLSLSVYGLLRRRSTIIRIGHIIHTHTHALPVRTILGSKMYTEIVPCTIDDGFLFFFFSADAVRSRRNTGGTVDGQYTYYYNTKT